MPDSSDEEMSLGDLRRQLAGAAGSPPAPAAGSPPSSGERRNRRQPPIDRQPSPLPTSNVLQQQLSEPARRLIAFEATWHAGKRAKVADGILVGDHAEPAVCELALHHVVNELCTKVLWCGGARASASPRVRGGCLDGLGGVFPTGWPLHTIASLGAMGTVPDAGVVCCTHSQLCELREAAEAGKLDGAQKRLLSWVEAGGGGETLLVLSGLD